MVNLTMINTARVGCLACFITASLHAQSMSGGTLRGTVIDPAGGAVPSAAVELSNPVTGYKRQCLTDVNA